MENKPAIPKQDIAKYVQDMAEIEAAEFTLRKAAEEMRSEIERTETENQSKIEKFESEITSSESRLDALKKQQDKLKDNLVCPDIPEEPLPLQEPEKPKEPKAPGGWNNYFLDHENPSKNTYFNETLSKEYKYLEGKRPIFSYTSSFFDYLKDLLLPLLILTPPALGVLGVIACIITGTLDITVTSLIITIVSYLIITVTFIVIMYNLDKRDAYKIYQEKLNNYDKYSAYIKARTEYNKKYAEYTQELAKVRAENDEKISQYRKLQREVEIKKQQWSRSYDSNRKIQQEIDNIKKKMFENKKALLDIQDKQKKDKAKHTIINAQIEILNNKIQEIHSKKQFLYKVNIIPPDYRELDCVIMFHQIFRNDLADTMREAVKIYEERVFRQEVIRGIDRIYQMLGRLSASMSLIENRLVQIRDEVKLMGNDVYQISEKMSKVVNNQKEILESMDNYQASTQRRLNDISQTNAERQRVALNSMQKQQHLQEEQLAETRASRYATEALKDATDKLVYYENMKYWQSL